MKHHVYLLIKACNRDRPWGERVFYVGITKDIKKRIGEHINSKENLIKEKIMEKYGFIVVSLWQVDTRKEAEEREKFLISYFGRMCDKQGGQLANLTFGGDGRQKWTDKEKQDMSERYLSFPIEQIKLYIEGYKHFDGTAVAYSTSIGVKTATFYSWLVKYNDVKQFRAINITEKLRIENNKLLEPEIERLYKNGHGFADISRILKIGKWTVERYIRKKLCVAPRKTFTEDEKIAHVLNYESSGLTFIKYCSINNLSMGTVYIWRKKYTNIVNSNTETN